MPRGSRKSIYKPLVPLPPLSADEYEGLRSSIAASGVAVPIIVWQKGRTKYIIDGSHRKKVADELGRKCPEVFRSNLTEEHARSMACALNLARRHLDREQKRQPERKARGQKGTEWGSKRVQNASLWDVWEDYGDIMPKRKAVVSP